MNFTTIDYDTDTYVDLTNRELAEVIYDNGRVLQHYTMLDLLALVAGWNSEELNQIDPDPRHRHLTERDQIRIISELADIFAENY